MKKTPEQHDLEKKDWHERRKRAAESRMRSIIRTVQSAEDSKRLAGRRRR